MDQFNGTAFNQMLKCLLAIGKVIATVYILIYKLKQQEKITLSEQNFLDAYILNTMMF